MCPKYFLLTVVGTAIMSATEEEQIHIFKTNPIVTSLSPSRKPFCVLEWEEGWRCCLPLWACSGDREVHGNAIFLVL